MPSPGSLSGVWGKGAGVFEGHPAQGEDRTWVLPPPREGLSRLELISSVSRAIIVNPKVPLLPLSPPEGGKRKEMRDLG